MRRHHDRRGRAAELTVFGCLALGLLPSAGCGGADDPGASIASDWTWNLASGFPEPRVPDDNPMSLAKVELGRLLFYDIRLSGNQTQSCGTCHQQARAFTDGRPLAIGSTGEIHPRNSMGLTNVAYAATLTWANPLMRRLAQQALVPMFGEDPIELGLAGMEQALVDRLADDPAYPALFSAAFPNADEPITIQGIADALASFQRTLISFNAPYDHYIRGDADAISASARRGLSLFFSERLECFHCHGGFNFSNAVDHDGNVFDQAEFHNNGLYNTDGRGAYPLDNTGLFESTGLESDMGRFKAPTLRNVALTAPYMHDGSLATLEQVLDHYARGGREIVTGPHAGDGATNPHKSSFISGFTLTAQERRDLLDFLHALTDTEFVTHPAFSDPFAR